MQRGHAQDAMNKEMTSKHYTMLALNLTISLLIMYLAMFAMIWSVGDFFNNANMLYMALVMLAGLAVRVAYAVASRDWQDVQGDALTYRIVGTLLAEGQGWRRFEASVAGAEQWGHVLSPNAFATEVLQRALGVAGPVHELGVPRADVLAPGAIAGTGARVRARLGLAADARVVLYAPTFRDHVIDRRGRPRLDLHLDVARLRDALGPGTVLLFRKHHLVLDPVPVTADGFVRDVTGWPDAAELLAAADVLVSDYSSLVGDFAAAGRPVVLFAYDLETYRDEVRGLYVDLEAEGPGPVVRSTDDVAEAVRAAGAQDGWAQRRAAFAERYGPPVDGGAAARAADLLVGPEPA